MNSFGEWAPDLRAADFQDAVQRLQIALECVLVRSRPILGYLAAGADGGI